MSVPSAVTRPRVVDRAHLARAIVLSAAAVGSTSPNPAVGCVIVDRAGTPVGEGATAPVGGPHAEVVALRAAGDAARGGTAYVTLEPCAHHGRTPPCSDALLRAGVARVVLVHGDPNPVAAGGAARLRAEGVDVVGPLPPADLLHASTAAVLEGFLSVVRRGRPHLTLKLAQRPDGGLVAAGDRRWITGPAARTSVHRLRARADGVLVGVGTVLADDPHLGVRHVPVDRQPRPVVLDSRLRTPVGARVVRRGALLVTTSTALTERPDLAAALRDAGADLVGVDVGPDGRVALAGALAALSGHGITSLLAEPGATLAGALVAGGFVDRLVLHIGVHGDDGTGPPARAVAAPPSGPWRTERCGGAGPDAILHLIPPPDATEEAA